MGRGEMSYPYVSYWCSKEDVLRIGTGMNVTDRATKWPYASSPRPEALVTYYNDEGTPMFKTFSFRRDHFRGLDAIPQLVQEGSVNGTWKPIGLELWSRIEGPSLESLAVALRDRGSYFASNKSNAITSDFTAHRDLFVRDMGQSLHKLDDEQGYHYVRTQLLLESISKELVFYPLSILVHLVSGAHFDYIGSRGGGEGYEMKVLRALKAYNSLKYDEEGIKLGKNFVIRRGGVSEWVDVAHSITKGSFTEKKGKQVIIMEHSSPNLDELKKLRVHRDTELYIIVRLPYVGPLDPSLVLRLAKMGYQYRGVHVYSVAKVRPLKYPIWYFSRTIVNDLIFPPIFKSHWSNNEAPLFPPETPSELPERTLVGSSLHPFSVGANSMTFYGATNHAAGSLRDARDFSFPREGKENIFLVVLLPSDVRRPSQTKKPTYVNTNAASVHKTYHSTARNTTLVLYRGGFGHGQETYGLEDGWSLTRRGDGTWILHSTTATSITTRLWTRLAELQTSSYTKLVASISTRSHLLSYYSAVKYWSEMRSTERPTELQWEGETYQHGVVRDGTRLSVLGVGTVNTFGLFDSYTLPVQTTSSMPAPFWPLPLTQGTAALYREVDGALEIHKEDVSHVVLSVTNGSIDFPNPFIFGEMQAVEEEDGLYEASLAETLWVIEKKSDAIIPDTFSQLLSYYIERAVYHITPDDLLHPPPLPRVTVMSPLHVEGRLSEVETIGSVTMHTGESSDEQRGLVMALARSSSVESVFVADVPHEYVERLGGVSLSSPSPLIQETRYTSIYATEEQLASLVVGRPYRVSVVPKRTLVASSRLIEGITTDFYMEEEERELLVSAALDGVFLSWRSPYEEGAEEAFEGLDSETAFSIGQGLYPLILSSPTVEGKNTLKRLLLQALFA